MACSLSDALVDWTNYDYPKDFEDTCFVAGYRSCIDHVLKVLETINSGSLEANLVAVRRLDNLDENVGN